MADVARIHVGKLEAARRQFSSAISLQFSNGDPIAVHTLVGASSIIISDLVEAKCPERSWDRFAQDANDLSPEEYFRIMRLAQNFLKHAKNDPGATLDYDPADSDSLGFWITLNLGELGCQLTAQESVFQLWYLACYSPVLDEPTAPHQSAIGLFGDLRNVSRDERIRVGAAVMAKETTNDA
ncbi:MAG: hypothetical protein RLO46_14320 [Pseudomonadales bacterium]